MKVYEPAPGKLALLTRPNWLLMLLGIFLVLMGLVAAGLPGKSTELTLSRDRFHTGAGEIHVKTIIRDFRVVRIPLRLLKGAVVTPGTIGGRASFYHLDLDVRDGLGLLYFAWYADKRRVEADAATINRFIADPTQTYAFVANDKRGIYYPLGGAIAAIGLVLLLWSSLGVRVLADQGANRLTVWRRGMLGTHQSIIPFDQIQDFRVAGITGDCQLFVELKTGRKVTLSASSDMQNMIGPTRIRPIRQEEADRLREFCRPEA